MKKKLIAALSLFTVVVLISCAIYFYIGYKDSKKEINLNGSVYSLKYSDCSIFSDNCINKYYKEDEFDSEWSELISFIYIKPVSDPHLYTSFLKREKKIRQLNKDKEFDVVTYMTPYKHNKESYIEQTTAKVMKFPNRDGIIILQVASRYPDPIKYIKQKDMKKATQVLQKMYSEQQIHTKFLTPIAAPDMYFRHLNEA